MHLILLDWTRMGKTYCLAGVVLDDLDVRIVRPLPARNRSDDVRKWGCPELKFAMRKCLHHYHYSIHPDFGFMHVRVQTWMPMTVHVCVNGREWLGRRMDRAGLGYTRAGNCFTRLDDPRTSAGSTS